MSALEPYRQLLGLMRRQAEALANGDLEGYLSDESERGLMLRALPETPPREAKPLLQELAALTDSNTAALSHGKEEVGRELARLAKGVRAMDAYQRQAPQSGVERYA